MLKVAGQTATASSPIVIDDSPPSKQSEASEEARGILLKKRSVWREAVGQSRKSSSPLAHFVAQKRSFEPIEKLQYNMQRPRETRVDPNDCKAGKEATQNHDASPIGLNTGQHLLDRLTGKFDMGSSQAFRLAPKQDKTSEVAHESLKVGVDDNPSAQLFSYPKETSLIESKAQLKRQNSIDSGPQKRENSLFPAIDEDVIDYDRFEPVSWVKGQASMTDNGCVRHYNEDCITAIPSVIRPERVVEGLWPKCSYFGIYDGHGGGTCSQYMMNNLHDFVFQSNHFPHNPKMALLKGFEQAEQTFVEQALSNSEDIDYSGSCAIVILIVNDLCYIANLGDSRVIGSYYSGKRIKQLSTDMKPCEKNEQLRVTLAGGKVYQSMFQQINPVTKIPFTAYGPLRVFPGRLNVCRSFGDVEAKEPRLGGKPGVIIAVPDVRVMKITPELDYLVIASDGIYDKLENEEVVNSCWKGIQRAINTGEQSIDEICKVGVEEVMKLSLLNKTQDNISTIMISFKSPHNLHRTVTKQDMQKNFHERLCNMLKKSKPHPKSAPQEAIVGRQRLTAFEKALLDDSLG